ncbi:PREDICTED: uncharacterized protein LOC101295203 [Fragaria vesca subsp. vesca]|uniref:uncharacterized protein LOC101295203 n=1 Tax=Fragaria vesca subsp. vesca TaxID=101020 RepID=UPI0002C36634|nr:PREDICTED: uncharacterized protein LOC101295203 [Fragaria vesca subsp. vesca]
MASNLLRLHTKTITTPNPASPFSHTKTLSSSSLPFPSTFLNKTKTLSLSPLCSLTPPNSKEAAIQQAKTCLTTTLEKPLNNLRLTSKLKKLKQPRFRIEIPVADDSPESLSQLALHFFKDLPIKRKGSPVNILVLWPDITSAESAVKAFMSSPASPVEHLDIPSVANGNTRISNTADVAVFLAPEPSQVAVMKTVAELLYPRPVVMFNPKWGFEEEAEFGELSGFVGSFEVIFSFMGLEVKGLLSKRNGVVFKCVRNGVVSGEKWAVLVEEEQGELKLVSAFKTRPSISEVEYVLYNLMAMNSTVTKSVKFFRDLVSNVTGKK